jgi:putative heme-binding domain-containing protein
MKYTKTQKKIFVAAFSALAAFPAAAQNQDALHEIPAPNVEEELSQFVVADGFEVNLFASDPMVANPIAISWDGQGRLWVAGSSIYPHIAPGQKPADTITVLEDTDGDGVADASTVFAEGLFIPTGILPGDGGVYVCNSTEILHLSDTDGDGKADTRRAVLSGFGTEDTHQTIHSLRWGVDGFMYINQSIYIHSHLETPNGVKRLGGGGIWQFNPRSLEANVLTRGFVNPWGHDQDAWGQSFATDGAYHEGINHVFPGSAFLISKITPFLSGMNPGSPKHCGLEILSGSHLPEDWRGNYITNDFRAHRVCRFIVKDAGSTYTSEEQTELIKTQRVTFRPVDVKMGPDGAIYIADWYNPIIQHGEVAFRDPRRDHEHGRIWRVTAKGRPLVPRPQIAGASAEGLVKLMTKEEDWTRLQARQALKNKPIDQVVPALEAWTAHSTLQGLERERQTLEALWTWQTLDIVKPELLLEGLAAKDFHARAAAVRIMSHWLPRLEPQAEWRERAKALALDEHPRVRLEAIRLLGTIPNAESALAALEAFGLERDRYLDYALLVTLRDLKTQWLPEVNKENPAFTDNAERLLFALDAVASEDVVPALIHALAKGRFNDDQTVKAVTLVAAHGDAAQAGTVVEQLCTRLEKGDEIALWAWEALYKGTSGRGVIPASGLERAVKLIDRQPGYTQTHAIEAAGAWRIAAARPALNALLANPEATTEVQERAIRALQGIGGDESKASLLELSQNHPNRATRLEAIRAVAGMAPEESASAAFALMQAGTSEGEVKALLDTFLKQEPALNALTKVLEGQTLPVETAKQAARTLSSSGRNVDTLMAAVRTAGGLDALANAWTPEAMAALVAKVKAEGDPVRGELQFRSLACSQCHAIGGAGGLLGPDLSSIGGSAQVDYLVESILQPAKAVKEGYHSIIVETSDLETFSGVKIQENDTTMVLRDVNGEHTIYKDKIDNIEEGTSLMPVGLADSMLENELADLVSFLSSLGRVPEWSLGTDKVVRGWQVLQNTPEGLERMFQDGAEVVGVGHEELTWGPGYSKINGELPLAELPLLNHRYWHNKGYSAARFSLSAAKAGTVNLALGATEGLEVWVNGERVVNDQLGAVEVPQGDSTVTILVRHDTAAAPLRAQVQEAGDTAVTLKLAGK